ncbi:MAG: methyltransferase domain-containing protein, partial [Treponema sp.]|nr:methyltransferase domain-containing protein [Treponema sp.]
MEKYNAYFFIDFYEKNGGGDYTKREQWLPFFSMIADNIIKDFNPVSVLDAGCALGYLVEALRDRGVDAYGFDISEFAISHVREDVKPYCFVNSITEKIPEIYPRKYDVVVSIEVLEHLSPQDGAMAIKNLCRYSDTIIFTSTPDDITDRTHVNVQLQEYWCREFSANSFFRNTLLSLIYICPWAMLFEKRDKIEDVIFDYEMERRINAHDKKQSHLEKRWRSGFYFDTGNGFNDDEKTLLRFNAGNNGDELVYHEIALPDGAKAVRFDPVEDAGCLLYDLEIVSLSGALKFDVSNGISCDNGDMIFAASDPQILISGARRWIKLWYKIIPFTDIAHFHLIENYRRSHDAISELKVLLRTQEAERRRHSDELAGELSKLREECEAEIEKLNEEKEAAQDACNCYSDELDKLREKYEARIVKTNEEKEVAQNARDYYSAQRSLALAERDALQAKLFSAESAFNSIINSEFWRITKPARVIMDITKLVLKRLPLIKYLYKFIARWKNFGFKNAIANVKVFFLRKRRESHKNYQILPIKEYKRQENTRFEKKVKFSVLTPLYNTPEKLLVEMIESVENQTYKDWELCLADGSDGHHGHVE